MESDLFFNPYSTLMACYSHNAVPILDTAKLLLEELEELLRLLQVVTNTPNLNMTINIQK